jgi:uncharacterized protein (TIGR02145 family)
LALVESFLKIKGVNMKNITKCFMNYLSFQNKLSMLIPVLFAFLCFLPGCKKEGSVEKTVKIGEQVWMAENLNVEKYRNGDPIPHVTDPEEWKNLKTGAWCYYDNDPENGKKYGKLYNWYAVNDPRGLAPEGWHVPTLSEFETVKAAVNNDGHSMKAVEQGKGTNSSGFSALLGGFRDKNGKFNSIKVHTFFWSLTEYQDDRARFLNLSDKSQTIRLNPHDKNFGFSIRCIKTN